jgi:hypothetical protein
MLPLGRAAHVASIETSDLIKTLSFAPVGVITPTKWPLAGKSAPATKDLARDSG